MRRVVAVRELHRAGRRVEVDGGHAVREPPRRHRGEQVAQDDGAGRVAHEMQLQVRAPGVGELLQGGDQQVAAAARAEGQLGVLLHLAPDRARQRAADGLLDQQVGALRDHLAQAGAGQRGLLAEGVGDDVAYRLQHAGLPHQEQRVAVVADQVAAQRPRALDGVGLAVEATVRIDHEPLLLAALGLGAEPLVGQAGHLVQQAAVGLVLGQVAADAAVVAEHHAVAVGLVLAPPVAGVGAAAGDGGRAADGVVAHAAHHHARHADGHGPRGHRVRKPVAVAQHRKAAEPELGAPGVLHDEAAAVEAHQRERMAVALGGPAVPGNERQGGVVLGRLAPARHVVPAAVREGRDVDRAHLLDRGLQVGDGAQVDTQVDTQRRLRRALRIAVARLRAVLLGVPVALEAHAVVEPALQRAAAAGAVVVFAGVFVVAAREVVEHRGAHALQLGRDAGLAPAQVVHHAGQAEAGAGALLALVEDEPGLAVARQVALDVGGGRKLLEQAHGRRHVGAVAQVGRVLAHGQRAAAARGGGCGPGGHRCGLLALGGLGPGGGPRHVLGQRG
eukprot:Opistho-1_new@86316